jgi:hypothetical protein
VGGFKEIKPHRYASGFVVSKAVAQTSLATALETTKPD